MGIGKIALVFFLIPVLPYGLSELLGGIMIGIILGENT